MHVLACRSCNDPICTSSGYVQTARRRPRRVPAFGEWNYYHGGDELPSAAAAGGAPDDQEASSDVWFRYSPAPRKPAPKKARTRAADNRQKPVGGGNKRRPARTSSSDSGAATAASNTPAKLQQAAATAKVAVVRRPPAVDADLYQVPPPDFLPGEPIRRVLTYADATRLPFLLCFLAIN